MEVKPLGAAWVPQAAQVMATAPEGWSETALTETIESPAGRLFGLWQEDILLGVAVFQLVLDEVSLEGITLSPDCRGQGLGKLFLSSCLDALKAEGASFCFLEVRSQNTPAIHLYEGLGFQAVGMRKHFYHDPPDHALTYKLILEDPA